MRLLLAKDATYRATPTALEDVADSRKSELIAMLAADMARAEVAFKAIWAKVESDSGTFP